MQAKQWRPTVKMEQTINIRTIRDNTSLTVSRAEKLKTAKEKKRNYYLNVREMQKKWASNAERQ